MKGPVGQSQPIGRTESWQVQAGELVGLVTDAVR